MHCSQQIGNRGADADAIYNDPLNAVLRCVKLQQESQPICAIV